MAETKVRDYAKLASDILQAVGGKNNVTSASRCATRLRLVLKETTDPMKETISQFPGVITVLESGGQLQIVIGTHVGEVFDSLSPHLDLEEKKAPKQSILNRVIATMSAVFAPFIYVLAAAGILQGVLIVVSLFWASFENTGTYTVLNFISWTPFTYLPIFIAITASKHFKCSTYIAVACCLALVNTSWAEIANAISDGEVIKFLGISLSSTQYTSTVLAPLFLVWILSYLEHFLNKALPSVIQPLFSPFVCIVVMVPATILIIGPISENLANLLANGLIYLYEVATPIAAAVKGGFWQVLVIFGVHWGVTPVYLAMFDSMGEIPFQAYQTAAVIGQVGAAMGCYIKSRNREFKGVALSATVTGIFGITEPAIYGVTLRMKKPFVCGCISGCIGAVVMSLFGTTYYAYAGLPGPLTIINAISADNPSSFVGMLIGCAIAFFGAIVLVQIIGFKDQQEIADVQATPSQSPKDISQQLVSKDIKSVLSPLAGDVLPLSEVPDDIFSTEVLGKGVAIDPSGNQVFAPFDGTVMEVPESRHAIGLISVDGLEVLIHIGLDTVKMGGQGFRLATSGNSRVKAGDLLLEFDPELIQDAGYSLISPVIVTNSDEYSDVLIYPGEQTSPGANLLGVIK